jgi:hypothetical protein
LKGHERGWHISRFDKESARPRDLHHRGRKFCVDPRAEGKHPLKSLPRPRIILPVTAFGIQSEFFSNPQDVVFLRDENISIL